MPSVVDAGRPIVSRGEPDAGFKLTVQMVDSYLQYQRATSRLPLDAGTDVRAVQDEALINASGLSETQLALLDEMVAAVIDRRISAQNAENPKALVRLSEMAESMTPAQKKHVEEALEGYQRQQQAAKDLNAERNRFGAENIEVLLSREAEVVKVWSDLMGIGPVNTIGKAR